MDEAEEIINGTKTGRLVLALFGKKVTGHWIGGALSNRYQEIVASWINSTPKRMTIINASVFGTFGALQYLVAGEGTGHFVSRISGLSGTPLELSGYLLAGFELAQNCYRIGYALKNDRGHISISPGGVGGTALCYMWERAFGRKDNDSSRVERNLDDRL